MKKTNFHFVVFLLWFVSTIAKTETLDAHVHGSANLTLAVENETVEIQFESPAENLIGFEHKASSPEELQIVKQTETVLNSPKGLFSFVGTICSPTETTVDVSEVMDSEHDHKEHDTGSKDPGNSNHSEITVSYRLNCKNTEKLDSIATTIFDQFPGIEKIKAIWVTKTQQGSKLLYPDRNIISFRLR